MSDTVRRAVRSGRKGHLIFAAGLIAVVSAAIACNDGGITPVELRADRADRAVASKEAPKKNPFAHVGKEHNEEVDYVLRQFAKRWKKGMKKSDICASLTEITQKYLATRGKSSVSERFYAPDDPCANRQSSLRLAGEGRLRTAGVGYDPNFSTRAIDLVNQISNIMLAAGSAAAVANQLIPINAEAMSTLGGNDAALVLGVSSIAESSAAYWEANLGIWVTVYSQGGNPPPLPFLRAAGGTAVKTNGASPQINWSGIGEVGWADVGGGIIGGIKGALGGPGGVLVGIGTGAAYSSIGAAIGQIVKILQKT